MTSTLAKTIFDQLCGAGLTMTLIEPDRLSVSPSGRLNDHLLALIHANKAELLASLIAANEPHIKQPDTCTAATLHDGHNLPPDPRGMEKCKARPAMDEHADYLRLSSV